jgi:3-oxoacyl-[acyl-carrier-protein] synthase II
MLAGESGTDRIASFDASEFPCQVAAEVKDFNPEDWLDKKDARRIDRVIAFSVAAAAMAMADSKVQLTPELQDDFGVMIGSGIGGLHVMSEQTKALYERGPQKVSPFWVPYMIADMSTGVVSIQHGLRGPQNCAVTACSTGANNIGDAYHIIKRGDATMMLAGGTEASINDIGVAAFSAARAMTTNNAEPTSASRPFDATRDGFVMGEGAAVLVLEELEHALARGAHIYGELIGYGMSGDAHHITAPLPNGDGAVRSMRRALRSAGLNPGDIDYINAHGTSTPLNDKGETAAIKVVFGDLAHQIPVSSTKSATGHTLGAAGAIEALICLLAMRDGKLPPTINYRHPDPECDLDYVPNVARDQAVKVALSNSFGFGGKNVSLVLRSYPA